MKLKKVISTLALSGALLIGAQAFAEHQGKGMHIEDRTEADMIAFVEKYPSLNGAEKALVDVLMQFDSDFGLNGIDVITDDFGIVQIVSKGNEVAYLAGSGRYLFTGDMSDLTTGQSVTQAKKDEINQIPWDNLPWDLAFSVGSDDAEHEIAVFTDVDCPYCKQLEDILAQEDHNIKVHYFLFPIKSLHPQAVARSERIACDPDPVKAMRTYMRHGTPPGAPVSDECTARVNDVLAFAAENGIQSTPTLFLQSGKRLQGAPRNMEMLMEAINEDGAPTS